MKQQPKQYCLIIGDNVDSLVCLIHAAKISGNSLFCYYFKDRDNNICAFPLANAFYKDGDFTITQEIFAAHPIHIGASFKHQLIEVSNAACDKVFADRIAEIEIRYILSQRQGAVMFMEQIGFPTECIEEYVKDGSIYFYDGFFREKITKINYPEVQALIRHLGDKVYAVVPEHFLNGYCCLSWSPDQPKQIPFTKDERFGKISIVRCHFVDKKMELINLGIMTSQCGVWSIPDSIASMKEYRNKLKL